MNSRRLFQTRWFQVGAFVTLLAVVASMLVICKSRQDRAVIDDDTKQISEETEKAKPKPPAYILPPVALPGRFPKADLLTDKFDLEKVEDFNTVNRVKAGHWATVLTQIVSNDHDAQAQLRARMTNVGGETLPVFGTDRWLNAIRDVSLPKGQWKQVETMTFVTPRTDQAATSATFVYELSFGRSRGSVESLAQPTIMLNGDQFLICVFDQKPARFRFLDKLDCVVGFSPMSWLKLTDSVQTEEPYHCVFSQPTDPAPWPRSALTATAIAYAVWSDFDPAALDGAQQQALIDWLHWGGNLIINGPEGLERLQGSFLKDYLPAEIDQRVDLTAAELMQFLQPWAALPPEISAPTPGCRLKPFADAQMYDESKLLCVRAIGRGRIVATGFSLNAESLLRWPCFSNFFNGALLGKSGRAINRGDEFDRSGRYSLQNQFQDPSRMWYVSRDLHSRVSDSPPSPPIQYYGVDKVDESLGEARRLGNAAWNDLSRVPNSAGTILRRRATITPPSSKFVLKVLVGYLLLLIPINWAVFRFMGKLEWAWVAAPVISIIGALAVTRLAALDIGFTRAKDTIAVLELHEGYSRGHLAEFSALYSSLSTNFRFEFDQNDAQLLPLLVDSESLKYGLGSLPSSASLMPANCSRGQKTAIENYQIRSNTAGFLHAERMVEAGGSISLQADATSRVVEIDNASSLTLHDAIVFRRVENQIEAATLVQLSAGTKSAPLKFAPIATEIDDAFIKGWLAQGNWPFDQTDSFELFDAIFSWQPAEGEYRLIALCDDEVAPMTCRPVPTRSMTATVVAVSLRSQLHPIESDSPELWSLYQPSDVQLEDYFEPEEFDR